MNDINDRNNNQNGGERKGMLKHGLGMLSAANIIGCSDSAFGNQGGSYTAFISINTILTEYGIYAVFNEGFKRFITAG